MDLIVVMTENSRRLFFFLQRGSDQSRRAGAVGAAIHRCQRLLCTMVQ